MENEGLFAEYLEMGEYNFPIVSPIIKGAGGDIRKMFFGGEGLRNLKFRGDH